MGAINDITADPYNNSDVTMSSFSDWGPTDDGRMKPDVVGNGVRLISPTASSNSSYGNFSGTSMAAPNVTGTTALLYEHYNDLFSATPRSATMKGLLIHTAFDAGNFGPDYTYGWGVVDGAAAASFLTDVNSTNGSSQLIEGSYTGSTQTISIAVNPGDDLKATLVWTDLPGTAHSNGLDQTTPVLVNDLDLSITGPNGTTYYPFTLNPANPSGPAVQNTANNLDNVEQVLIDATPNQSGTYTINIEGGSFNQDYSLLISGVGNLNTGNDSFIGETGTISNLTHTGRIINLSRNYQNPVVFAQPLSFNGSAPATVRLDSISSNFFEVSVQEPNNEDGSHAGENLSYIVMEAGEWQLPDGTILEVGTTNSNQLVAQGWETVNFNADFNSNPVVMSQVQTLNGADFVRTRQRNIGTNGFQVGMEEEEANATSGHANEIIGYMAMSGGSGNWGDKKYAAGYTGDNVTDAWKTQSFGAGFTQTPQVLASLASYDGADPAGIRYRNLNSNQVQFKVEEDTSADAEMAHTTENVSFLAIEGTGLLTGSPVNTGTAMGETGTISNLTHTGRIINLSRSYQNPVVFAQPLSFNGSAPATVRLDSISSNFFEVSVQEPNNEDGTHAGENLSYIVMEAGTWELADGTKLEVGTTNSNQLVAQGWESVNFNAGFNSNPVVMSQVQTLNGADFVRTRQRNIGSGGFQVGMEEEEANATSGHTNEIIGYMAMSGGSGNWSGLNYTAGYTGDNVTDAWKTQSFGAGFTQAPQVLASLASYDGADPAGIRYRNLNSNQVQFKVEEDTSADAEMAHTTENVSYLAIEGSGLLSATPLTNPLSAMGETGTISNLTHTGRIINLSRNYQNPVVFAQPLSFNGSAPATVRLDSISSNSFEVSVQEPNNEDGAHAAENLSYIVMEAGTWELADGTTLEVGTTNSSQLVAQGFETVNFNADFDNTPVVMSQVQTLNGADFVRTRQDDITGNGFLVGMEEEEANATSGHANEIIGYMAISGGSGNWSGLNYTAGYTGDNVTDAWKTQSFGAGFTQTPQILASLASYDGADPAGIRRRNLNNNQVQFKVEEDTSVDAEMAHTTENVSFLAIEGSGILEAVDISGITALGEDSSVLPGVETADFAFDADYSSFL